MIGDLIAEVDAYLSNLQKHKAINVNAITLKEQGIEIARSYFANVRPILVESCGERDDVLGLDEDWQNIVRLAHGNNLKTSYVKTLKNIKKALTNFNIALLTTPIIAVDGNVRQIPISGSETRLLDTLEALVPSAAASYRQGIDDLNGPERLSYRGTATEFREALRETLDHLAPNEEVMQQAWFKQNPDTQGPTMAQKTRYVLSSRGENKTQWGAAEKTLKSVEELVGDVTRAVYNRASLATHVQQSKSEVERIKRYVDTVLFDLLEV